jgi:hypothetical protein
MAELYKPKYHWECPYLLEKDATTCSLTKKHCNSADITECLKFLSLKTPRPDTHNHEMEVILEE